MKVFGSMFAQSIVCSSPLDICVLFCRDIILKILVAGLPETLERDSSVEGDIVKLPRPFRILYSVERKIRVL